MRPADRPAPVFRRAVRRPADLLKQVFDRVWPHVPFGLFLILIGILNLAAGMRLPLATLQRMRALHGLARSLSAIGSTAQAIIGLLLMIAGVAAFWRIVSAWIVSVLLLATMVAVNIAQRQWGFSFDLQAVILVALLLSKHRFDRRTAAARVVFSLSGIAAVLVYGTFGAYLLGDAFSPPVHDFGTAFYFAIVTLSTVGYGDVPATPQGRWFVISLLVVGVGVFASAIASMVGPKINAELNRLFRPKGKTMDWKNHVILVGNGVVARNAADELKQRGLVFVQVVPPGAPAPAARHWVQGDPTSEAVLKEACIQNARMVVAASEDDGENAFIVLGAKELNPKVKVLAIASSALSMRRLKLAHADVVFSPVAVGTRILADLVQGAEIPPEFHDLLEG